MTAMAATKKTTNASRVKELNATIRYTMWSVFRASGPLGTGRDELASEVDALFEQLAAKDVVVRGTYDVSALRHDADLLVWWHAPTADALQEAYGRLRRTALGAHLEPVWSNAALHRPAEFNKSHLPAFLAGEEARAYICVYPFVRS
jgi:hydrogen peroxide-dependent heme synthase